MRWMKRVWLRWIAMKSSYRDLEPGTAPAGYKLGLARTHLTASMKFFFCGVDRVRLEVKTVSLL